MGIVRSVLALATGGFLLAAAFAPPARADEHVTLQLKWVWQGQFAGYIAAKEKGFYKAQGLDVTIRPGGPDMAPPQVLASGGADVTVDWLPSALSAREKGVPMVNIAQMFNRAGQEMVCWRSSGVRTPKDFKGKTIGVAFGGNEFPFLAWAAKLGYSTTGANPDIHVLKLGFNVDPLLHHQADCISTESYNEYFQILDAGVSPKQLITFPYDDYHTATLEDGLYVLQPRLKNPAFVTEMAHFVAGTIEGWRWVMAHPEATAKILVDTDPAGVATYKVQLRQIKAIINLIPGSKHGVGYLRPAAFNRTVQILLAGKSNPVITKKPRGAWTREVWDRAQAFLKK
jgi:NitT/TauT family transport system substrate-binding protein